MNGGLKAALALIVVGALGAAAYFLVADDSRPRGDTELVGGRHDERIVAPGGAMRVDDDGEAAPLDVVVDAAAVDAVGAKDSGAAKAARSRDLPRATIAGRVVDEVGRAVPDATVTFLTPSEVREQTMFRTGRDVPDIADLASTTTDIDGTFTLEGIVEPGDDAELRWFASEPTVVVAHRDHATRVVECVGLVEGEHGLGTIALAPGTRIIGRAVSEIGASLAGVRVTAGVESERSGFSFSRLREGMLVEVFNAVVTGADGRFSLTGLPVGDVWVAATRDDRRAALAEAVTERGVPTDVGELVLEPGESIVGTVVTLEGEPVEGATIRVSNVTPRRLGRGSAGERRAMTHEFGLRATTDADGVFALPGLTPGTYTVHAEADGYARGETANVSTGSRDTRVVLSPFGAVLVTLRSRGDGEPVDGAELEVDSSPFAAWTGPTVDDQSGPRVVVGADAIARETGEALDDARGRYLVTGVGADGVDLSIRAPGFALVEAETPGAAAGAVAELEVELVPEIVVRGRVVDLDGEPVDDATVTLERGDEVVTETTRDGREMRRIARSSRRRFGGGGEIDAELITARTDSAGTFELRGATAGPWELSADADGYARCDVETLELVEGESVDGVELALEQGGVVFGSVTDADGEPVAGARVLVSRVAERSADEDVAAAVRSMFATAGDGDRRTVTTDATGGYRTADLPPGEYDVQLAKGPGGMDFGGAMVFVGDSSSSSPSGVTARTQVAAGAEVRVDLVRPRSAVVEGSVLASGEPVEGVRVTLMPASDDDDPDPTGALRGLRRMMGGARTATTDRFGLFVFEEVEVGPEGARYELSAKVAGAGVDETAVVDVVPGGTAQADLVFDGATLRGRIVDADSGDGVPGLVVTVAEASAPQVSAQFAFRFAGAGGGGMSMDLTGEESVIRTDADGAFEVRFLDAGDYSVRTGPSAWVRADAGPYTVREDMTVDDVVIEVERGAVITGVVRSLSTGEPLKGLMMRLDGDGRPRMGQTDEQGRYRFEGLEAGSYDVVAQGTDFGAAPLATESVVLEAGEERAVDLDTDGSAVGSQPGVTNVQIRLGG